MPPVTLHATSTLTIAYSKPPGARVDTAPMREQWRIQARSDLYYVDSSIAGSLINHPDLGLKDISITRPYWPGIFILFGVQLPLLVITILWLRRLIVLGRLVLKVPRHATDLCPRCLYHLAGITTGVCPECGSPFERV